MVNPQNFLTNCCSFHFRYPWNKAQPIIIPKEVRTVQIHKKNKISLKNYSSLKHLKLSDLTKVSTQIPGPLDKSIIQDLDSIDKNLISQLNQFKEPDPYFSFRIDSIPDYRNEIQAERDQKRLQKSKSLPKVRFSYTSVQSGTSSDKQVRYKVKVRPNREENLLIQTSKQELRDLKTLKRQEQDDRRSTIQTILSIPRNGTKGPRSIISIDEDQEGQDFMKESFIIERHSGMKTIGRLL